MSVLLRDTLQIVARDAGVDVKPDVLEALIPDIEYRIREVIQDAAKLMRHSRRSVLTPDDVNLALRTRNLDMIHGHPERAPPVAYAPRLGGARHRVVDDAPVPLEDTVMRPVSQCPLAATVTAHWLAVGGVQPAIRQNPTKQAVAARAREAALLAAAAAAPAEGARAEGAGKRILDAAGRRRGTAAALAQGAGAAAIFGSEGAPGVSVRPVVVHVLSKELQEFFHYIKEAIAGSDAAARAAAVEALERDAGLHELVPYLLQHLHDEVRANLAGVRSLARNRAVLAALSALSRNSSLDLLPYLDQALPTAVTLAAADKLSAQDAEDHWSLRSDAAQLIAVLCANFSDRSAGLVRRVTAALARVIREPQRPPATHFGAITSLSELGADVANEVLMPAASSGYLDTLRKARKEARGFGRSAELRRCEDALMDAAVSVAKAAAVGRIALIVSAERLEEMFGDAITVAFSGGDEALVV